MYATAAEIVTHVGEDALLILADRDGDMLVEDGVVEAALVAASAEMDGYISAQYTLPLSTTSALLNRLCIDMAIYHLCDETTISEHRTTKYRDAIKTLTAIANGLIKLGITGAEVGSSGSGKATVVSPGGRVFGRGNLL